MRLIFVRTFLSLAASPAKRLPQIINTPLVAQFHAQASPTTLAPVLLAKKKRCTGWKYKPPRPKKAPKRFDQLRKCFGFKENECPCDNDVIRDPHCKELNKPMTLKKCRELRDKKRFWKAVKKQEKHWESVRYNRRWDH